MIYFLQGLTMGLAYVAPIGLQNLFVINSALMQERRKALLTAAVVIFFDVTLSMACFFGIGALMQHYEWLQMIILLVGSLIVLYIGIGLLRSRPEEITRSDSAYSLRRTISSAFIVTWFNPQALIDGTMMLGAFRVSLPAIHSLPFISGVISASCIWFTGITLIISITRDKFSTKVLRAINIICGIVIIFYGCRLLYSFIMMIL